MSVKFWSFLPDQEHLKNQAFKLAPAFLKNFEILTLVRQAQTVFVLEVFTDYVMFNMFLCTLMEVAAHVTNTICIAQITCKFVHNTLLVTNRLQFRIFQVVNDLFASKNWLQIVIDLSPKVTKLSANHVNRFLILEWHSDL